MLKWFKKTNLPNPEELRPAPKPDLVGCLGKLPTQAEFIRYQSHSAVIQQFDRWLQDNFLRCSREPYYRAGNPFGLKHGFMLKVAQQPLVIGYLQDSADQSGREYPVTVFCQLGSRDHILSALPAAYRNFFITVEELLQQNWQQKSTQALEYALTQLSHNTPAIDCAEAAGIATKLLLNTNYNNLWRYIETEHTAIKPAEFLYSFENIINQHKFSQLRLPIAKGEYREASISFWLYLIDTLQGELTTSQQVFWQYDANENVATMIIHYGELNEDLFQVLLGNKSKLELVDPLQKILPLPAALQDEYSFSSSTSLFDVVHFWANLRSKKSLKIGEKL